ncbi:hypothetical protein P8605_06905 [Streptomyces sp. T-3]|nr:hypothetical protein [Streptomyces sp. T-3]
MTTTLRSRCARTIAAGVLSAALLTAGTAGAFAAETAKPSPSASASEASITVTATPTEVNVGEMVHFTGKTKGLKIDSQLVLQHKNGKKWTNLKATTKVKNGSSYSLDAKLNTKGNEQLRIKGGDTVSPTVTITVK